MPIALIVQAGTSTVLSSIKTAESDLEAIDREH